MDNYLSLEQAANKIGVSYETFRKRKAIKWLAKSTNFVTQGASHVRLYPVSEFPAEIKGLLVAGISPTPIVPAALSPLRGGDFLPAPISPLTALVNPNSKESRLARASRDLLRIQMGWCECEGIASEAGCDRAFSAAVAAGRVEISAEILSALGWGKSSGISRGSLRRMRRGICHRNLDRPKVRKIDQREDLRNYIIAHVHEYAHANMTVLWRELIKGFADVPSLATLTRWVDCYKTANAGAYLKSTNPDKWKNKFMSAFGSQSDDVVQPNQRWELDSTPADILLVDGRYSVIAVIDVYTRRGNLLVSNRSKADAIIALMRQTILAWGAPEMVKTDNGADYASNAMANACSVLQIWQEFCPPYSPEKKPHVERFLGTFNHDWLPTLPGYAGHNVETRQAIRSQRSFADNRVKPDRSVELRLTAEEFQNACDNWLVEYNDRVHGALGMHSPNSRWEDARYFCPPVDLRNLDLLLAFEGERKVGKDGISYGGGKYIAGDLLPGDKVQISIDASEMGVIYVFDLLGNFICNAYDDSLKGLDRQKIAKEARTAQRQQIAAAVAEVKVARSDSNFKRNEQAKIAERVSGKVVDLPTHPDVPAASSPLRGGDLAVLGFPQVEHLSKTGDLAEKVVSIGKVRTATPEQLFERAWGLFSGGLEVDLTDLDCNRVWLGIKKGEIEMIFKARTDRDGQKAFLAWLGELAPVAKKEA